MGLKVIEDVIKTKKIANVLNFLLVFFLWGGLFLFYFLDFKDMTVFVELMFIFISMVVFCLIWLFSVTKFYKKRLFIIFFGAIPFFVNLFFLLSLVYFEGLSNSSFNGSFGF